MNPDYIKLVQSINAFNSTDDILIQNNYLLKLLEVKKGESLLDIGCSLGCLCKMMADLVGPTGRVTGVDISKLIISLAEESNPYQWLSFSQGDAMNLDIKDLKIDALSCVQLAEYLPDADSFISNAFRILKNKGRAIIVTTDWKSLEWSDWPKENTQKWESHCYDPKLHSTLEKKLIKAGFRSVYFKKYQIFNSEYLPTTYSYWLSSVVLEYMTVKKYFSKDDGKEWIEKLIYSNESGKYHFSVNRYIFLAKK